MHVVGARPNFMKVAPIMQELSRFPGEFIQLLVHTGQHYDARMSQVFFEELELPKPEVNLEVGSGSQAWQTAQIMLRFEPVINQFHPDWVFVFGDVNSTLACSLVCCKLGVSIAHIEAGLRSFDRTMPEEINRLLTDQISDLLFTPSQDADQNLINEGVPVNKVHFVGNVMLDTLERLLPRARARYPALQTRFRLDKFILVTLHRPSNVDDPKIFKEFLIALQEIASDIPVLFPVHPRTTQRIGDFGLDTSKSPVLFLDPLGYLDFLALQIHASLVLTDSGGVQEETTYLNIPCLTARENTERPITISLGTNRLVKREAEAIIQAIRDRLNESPRRQPILPLWDGKAAQRIVGVMRKFG
jgi:UDP-N-acetylglucosamine 2-epimerase (non-hydrolysing)